tara:strand:- start:462 stop:842 length:381 start_codon:yes stop_codon:yes gene_type:complete
MFANYDYSNFPIIKVDLSGCISNNSDFQSFINPWLQLYNSKKNFEFEFDTKNIEFINPIYCIYCVFFIKSIKKQNPQYLLKSKIYVYNRYILKLAKYIFYIEKPVAPVELILINKDYSQNIEYFYP